MGFDCLVIKCECLNNVDPTDRDAESFYHKYGFIKLQGNEGNVFTKENDFQLFP